MAAQHLPRDLVRPSSELQELAQMMKKLAFLFIKSLGFVGFSRLINMQMAHRKLVSKFSKTREVYAFK